MGQYSPTYYEVYRDAQATHWWFRARESVLQALVPPDASQPGTTVIDVGSGPGGPTPAIFPGHPIVAIDLDDSVLRAYSSAAGRLVADVGRLPLKPQSARVLCAFDILEHLSDDLAALRNWREVLAPGGRLVITVPAYQALWSRHDDVNGHHRRYRASLLRARLETAGFVIDRLTYFNTVLLPGIACVRWWQRLTSTNANGSADGGSLDFNHRMPAAIESCFQSLFSLERHWLRHWRLPAGVSVCALAHRPSADEERGATR